MENPHLIIVSSPSGGGKSTINRKFVETHTDHEIVTSYTTRSMRAGEENGREYFFVGQEIFEEQLSRGEMLEHALVHGFYYGTSKKEVERIWSMQKKPILEIDVQGFETIASLIDNDSEYSSWKTTSVFILPPSFEVLQQRLESRRSETPENLVKRLSAAKKEVAASTEYDFHIVNDSLEKAMQEFTQVALGKGLDDDQGKTLLNHLCEAEQ